jgi:hypothetical protein
MMKRIDPQLAHLVAATLGAALLSCGAADVRSLQAGVAVHVSPSQASVNPGGTVSFSASVDGPAGSVRTVNWSVEDPAAGTIDSDGVFHAASVTGTFTVVATSIADSSAWDSASVVVTTAPLVAVSVTPRTASVVQGGTRAFAATVSGTAAAQSTAVTWSVRESNGGTISTTGLYGATGGTGTFTVVATSVAAPTVSGTAAVTVTAPPPVQVQVTPAPATVVVSGTLQFSATVLNLGAGQSSAVTWTAPDAGGGTIDAAGLYRAPATAGTYHVRATSVAVPSAGATVAVTVTASGGSTQAQKVALVATRRWVFYHMSTGCNLTGGAWSGVPTSELVHDMVFNGTQPCGLYKTVRDAGGGLRVVHPPYYNNINAVPDDAPDSSATGQGAGALTAGTFWGDHILHNEVAESVANKIAAFDRRLRAFLGPRGSAQALARVSTTNPLYAGLKFCWVDDWTSDIVTRMFPTYQSTVAALEADYPGLHIIHFAAPLQPSDYPRNAYRVAWSDRLRATYPNWVFNTDYAESTRADGSTYTYSGARALAPEWSGDAPNGHLSEAGANWVGSRLLDFLADVAQR